jgi:hypothetical protein
MPSANPEGSFLLPREALDLIAALCDRAEQHFEIVGPGGPRWVQEVRAILADVTPEPDRLIDGGVARRVWAVCCDACDVWLSEWNWNREEAVILLREHLDEIHD